MFDNDKYKSTKIEDNQYHHLQSKFDFEIFFFL